MRLLCSLLLVLVATPAAAFEIGVRGTTTTPLGDFDSDEPTGALGLLFRLSEGPLALGIAVEGGEESGTNGDWYYAFEAMPAVLADAQLRLSTGLLQPFVGASAGIALGDRTVAVGDVSMTGFGANFILHPAAGLRVELPVIPLAIEADVGYRMLFSPGLEPGYLDDVGGTVPSLAFRLGALLVI